MKETSISLFKGYSDTHPQDSTLQEIVNLIRNDALVRDRTEKHRYYSHNGQKAAAAWEKAACPCFAVAVCFGGGKQAENITGWTSLALADIDHIDADRLPELIGRVRADKHTLLSYTTISGTGLRIIYRTDCLTTTPEKNRKVYSKIFEQGNRYYADLLGCECDLKCKNVTRLSGLAHDPDVYFNPDAAAMPVELKVDKKEQSAKPSIRNRRLEKAVAAAAGELAEQGIVYEAHQRNPVGGETLCRLRRGCSRHFPVVLPTHRRAWAASVARADAECRRQRRICQCGGHRTLPRHAGPFPVQ